MALGNFRGGTQHKTKQKKEGTEATLLNWKGHSNAALQQAYGLIRSCEPASARDRMIDTASNGGLPVPKKICVSRCLDPARPFQSAGLAGRDFVFTPSRDNVAGTWTGRNGPLIDF